MDNSLANKTFHARHEVVSVYGNGKPAKIDEYDGVTYREWLAGMAMQGMMAGHDLVKDSFTHSDMIASQAVAMADAIIKELEK